MSSTEGTSRVEPDDDLVRVYIFDTVKDHGRTVLLAAAAVAAVAALLAFVYMIWGQGSVRTASLEFRPTFSTAADGKYPNDLPFSPSDITGASILDTVYDANDVKQYCSREVFRSGLFVDQYSAAYSALEAEYQARLVDPTLSSIQRAQIQAEYQTRRAALPLGFRLVFLVPDACGRMPQVLVNKVLVEVLSTWAVESESRRGVLNQSVQVLTPNVLDVGLPEESSLLIRADLIRSSLRRLIDNVRLVEKLPGAALVRFGKDRVSLAEVRAKFEDLVQSRLEPLVVAAGRGLGADSLAWVEQALTTARLEEAAAEGRARAFLDALREYSGVAQTARPPAGSAPPQPGATDVQTLMPQIDSTFIDRIIDMSAENITFRQEMTRSMVDASVDAVQSRAKLSYYENLSASLRRPSSQSLPAVEVEKRLLSITEEGKRLTTTFNGLYEEFSRVSLRPQAGLYQTDQPVQSGVYRWFTPRSAVMLVLGVFVITLLLGLVVFIVRKRMTEPVVRVSSS